MIPVPKLMKIPGRARLRKCAVVLEAIERSMLSGSCGFDAYLSDLSNALVRGEEQDYELVNTASRLGRLLQEASPCGSCDTGAHAEELLRAVDALRHLCVRLSGQAPADWDLLEPRSLMPRDTAGLRDKPMSTGEGKVKASGLRVYLEDLRSPFNVGTIFRTAEAFGFSEVILSHDCADPEHPRALRSAMGAVSMLPWRRASLDDLVNNGGANNGGAGPLFALELGGTRLQDFAFPQSGTVIVGSEELGLTRMALAQCSLGKVSIPMRGIKASLNVAVAFGILANAWTSLI